jgi:hypothetical protein
MNDDTGVPPFLFHYIIVFICAAFIVCVCILKFKYLYWYSQPLTFRFTIRRWGGRVNSGEGEGLDKGRWNTNILNRLSLGERCYNAVVYPFLHNVNHTSVQVYGGDVGIGDAPFGSIAEFLSRRDTDTIMPGRREIKSLHNHNQGTCIPCDTLRIILSQETFGLSAFIGILSDAQLGADAVIKGVSILTPRIMLIFGSSSSAVPPRSVSIYMCDYLAWRRYSTSERESLELLETTEYIQKSREIAGEQTLYRYREIPWFVIPFTTVYTYMFSMRPGRGSAAGASAAAAAAAAAATANTSMPRLGPGMSVVPVSSVNFALFYSFVNECVRDFRCCIFNELTQLQSLVAHGVYRIYMLVLNQVRVVAVYLFAPSWTKMIHPAITKTKTKRRKTNGNRISALHEHITNTSTAVVKYLPPAISPKYDAFGKRVTTQISTGGGGGPGSAGEPGGDSILLLLSSIQHKSLCDRPDFILGFHHSVAAAAAAASIATVNGNMLILIDTFAHNYRLIDDIISKPSSLTAASPPSWKLLSQDKWYYILYNAIIHEETLCKDILMV